MRAEIGDILLAHEVDPDVVRKIAGIFRRNGLTVVKETWAVRAERLMDVIEEIAKEAVNDG